mgnify:CR=1 FL=1
MEEINQEINSDDLQNIEQEHENTQYLCENSNELNEEIADDTSKANTIKERSKPVREQLKARVREKIKEKEHSRVRKRYVGEKVRFQPRRNVKSREEYRKEVVEGNNNYQEIEQTKNIGTQYFQKIGGKWSRGYRKLKKKYITASEVIQQQSLDKNGYSSRFSTCVNACFAQQISAYKGFKEYGEKAVAAMMKELIQLDRGAVENKPVIKPISYDKLSDEDKRKALDAVNIVELKRDGRLKGRSCANGSKQRSYLTEYDSVASPTVSLEGIFTTLLIGAYEQRHHISFDVPGAFLQAEMPDDKVVVLKFKGKMAEMLAEVNDEYSEQIVFEDGKKVLYVKVVRAIYGCIESALQWYKLFKSTLETMGFELNPYDKCIANKNINGKQLTICWHVDDCIVSHAEEDVLEEFSKKMIEEFGNMDIIKGRQHDFLGMKIGINEDKTVSVDMREQLKQVIEEFEKYDSVDQASVTPAASYLFTVNPNAKELDKEHSVAFHSITAKLGYIMKRGRPDVETCVSFLMKRVSKSDIDDWNKLRRLIGFLKGTIDDIRIIGATSLTEIMTYIDSAYAVHENMRSHTGGLVSFGIGAAHARSTTSKLNVKSATESELVSASEYLPYTLWFRHFMEAQGYKIENNIMYQDNKSAILMEINGRNSCTGNSRHINIRYFWIKDRVDKGEVKVEYLPTHIMLADYFTKPLQGSQFRVLREFIMGWRPMKDLIIMKNDEKSEN